MKILTALVCSTVLATFLFVASSGADNAAVIKSIVDARKAAKTLPLPSAQIPKLTLEKAYGLQRSMTESMLASGETIGGFKAGLTATPVQKKFGVGEPLLGPLFKSGELADGVVLDGQVFVRLFVETEVGFLVGERIDKKIRDTTELKKKIKAIFPAVEFPDLRFSDMKNVKGADIVADAVGSAKYLIGKKIPVDKVDLSKVEVELIKDGQSVNKGKAADAMGDQWKALLWLVNGVVSKGWAIEPNAILITGAMGKMIPGKPGEYVGNYGLLGKVSFTIK